MNRRVLLTLVALVIANTATAQETPRTSPRFKLTAATFAGLAAVDVAQTTPCVRDGSCREVNGALKPLAGSYAGMAAVKGAIVSTFVGVAVSQHRQGRRKTAWTILGAATAAQAAAILWNIQHPARRPR